MKWWRWLSILLVMMMLAGFSIPVQAQDYLFQVEQQQVEVQINDDGTVSLYYTINFYCEPGAHAIDYIDIGMPNGAYELNSVSAEIDGKVIKDISNSTYEVPGITLALGSDSIQPGQRGKVYMVVGTVRDMIFKSDITGDVPYASFEFSPSWFDSQYVNGKTDMTVMLFLPKGMSSDQPYYFTPQGWPGEDAPESGFDNEGRVFYKWHSTEANAYTQYIFGAAFPSSLVPESVILSEVPKSSGGSGFSFNFDNLCPLVFCLGFLGFTGLSIYGSTIGAKKRKLQYLPPKISIEGNGIKRGLTAVEAALVMEQPLDRIMTMMLFSVLKKDAATVVSKEPLRIEPTDPLPDDLYDYEKQFISAFKQPTKAAQRKELQDMMIALVRTVGEKMKGFSRKETIAYYQDIMRRAWEQVQTAATPEIKAQLFDENMDWTMLDKQFPDKTREVFSGPMVIPSPSWWWRYEPSAARPIASAHGAAMPSSAPSMGSSRPSLPGSDFAAGIARGVEGFAAGIIGDVAGFTGGVTNRTNPPPPPSTRTGGSRSSGGHSCACACACAGCACACAGGGR